MIRIEHRRLARAVMAALLVSGLTACAPARIARPIKSIGLPVEADGFEAARRSPLDARAHYATSLALLGREGRTRADIEMARSGFRTAARLAPDLWEPLAGLAAAEYRLGNNRESMAALAQAIERKGAAGTLAAPFALLSFRAGEPELARIAASRGGASDFLNTALQPGDWQPAVPAPRPASAPPSNSEGRSVVIEAFMIRDTRQSSVSEGLNLLDSLSVQFGGTLLNYSYDSNSSPDTQTGGFSVTAPSIAYSLNIAARDRSHITLEASPLVLARQGKTSKFLEGGSVLIVPLSDDSDPVERNVGIVLEVTPEAISADSADLNVVLELSNITGQSLADAGRGASLLQTDKTRVEVAARVPFGKAIVVGSAGSLARREGSGNSLTPMPLPGLSRESATASSRNVLVLLTVRDPDDHAAPVDAGVLARAVFAADLPAATRYARRPSETPDPGIEKLLPTRLD